MRRAIALVILGVAFRVADWIDPKALEQVLGESLRVAFKKASEMFRENGLEPPAAWGEMTVDTKAGPDSP